MHARVCCNGDTASRGAHPARRGSAETHRARVCITRAAQPRSHRSRACNDSIQSLLRWVRQDGRQQAKLYEWAGGAQVVAQIISEPPLGSVTQASVSASQTPPAVPALSPGQQGSPLPPQPAAARRAVSGCAARHVSCKRAGCLLQQRCCRLCQAPLTTRVTSSMHASGPAANTDQGRQACNCKCVESTAHLRPSTAIVSCGRQRRSQTRRLAKLGSLCGGRAHRNNRSDTDSRATPSSVPSPPPSSVPSSAPGGSTEMAIMHVASSLSSRRHVTTVTCGSVAPAPGTGTPVPGTGGLHETSPSALMMPNMVARVVASRPLSATTSPARVTSSMHTSGGGGGPGGGPGSPAAHDSVSGAQSWTCQCGEYGTARPRHDGRLQRLSNPALGGLCRGRPGATKEQRRHKPREGTNGERSGTETPGRVHCSILGGTLH